MEDTKDPVFRASCQCGSVSFVGTKLPRDMTLCHCRTCCKISGNPCPWMATEISSLRWIAKETLVEYHTSDIAKRGHCRTCGSVIFMQYHFQLPHTTYIPAGLIDEDSVKGKLPDLDSHIYCSDSYRPSWDKIPEDGLKRWDVLPSRFERDLEAWKAENLSK